MLKEPSKMVVFLLAGVWMCFAKPQNPPPGTYSFEFEVKDEEAGVDFAQNEQREGNFTEGSYQVQLADTRFLTVTYYVDGESGYVAEVTYEGEAQYPPEESAQQDALISQNQFVNLQPLNRGQTFQSFQPLNNDNQKNTRQQFQSNPFRVSQVQNQPQFAQLSPQNVRNSDSPSFSQRNPNSNFQNQQQLTFQSQPNRGFQLPNRAVSGRNPFASQSIKKVNIVPIPPDSPFKQIADSGTSDFSPSNRDPISSQINGGITESKGNVAFFVDKSKNVQEGILKKSGPVFGSLQ